MNNTNQNHTDNFFRQGLNSPPEFSPTDKNWEEMERLLKPEAKRGAMAWIYPVSGIAAALLVFLSLWIVSDKTDSETQQPQVVKVPEKVKEAEGQAKSNPNSPESNDTEPRSAGSLTDMGSRSFTPARRNAIFGIGKKEINLPQRSYQSADVFIARQSTLTAPLTGARYATIETSFNDRFASHRKIETSNAPAKVVSAAINEARSPDIETSVSPGRWALSLAVSPDVNSVKAIDNGDLGMSMGMSVSYRLGKVLSVGTGIYYSKKLYSANKTSYKVKEKPFATWTSYSKQIDADCRVIDVPLNLSLRLTNQTQNKLYATAGISSYVMLSEKYDFVYNNPSPAFPTGRREYTVTNKNKHLLSVVNLGVALERPVSDQVSIVIEPYAKLPLTGIGQGETDLKSFGVGFKLNYSLR